eukprot:1025532-Prorocentrum_minimum.AAC.1
MRARNLAGYPTYHIGKVKGSSSDPTGAAPPARAPACTTRRPSLSKKRPPPTICGTPVTMRRTAPGRVRYSTLPFVPCTARTCDTPPAK